MPYDRGSPYSAAGTPRPETGGYSYMYSSPTPTPSPRHYSYDKPPMQRPATRASHVRAGSGVYPDPTVRPPTASPRYKSTGEYGTISGGLYSSATPTPTPNFGFRDAAYETTSSRRSSGRHSRRASVSTPKKEKRTESPSTSTFRSTTTKKPVATEEDRRAFKIPKGYSIKNWDPTETPILLLGSVFDANSLGKWIYDWTANVHGANSPFADMAGELWLLLIQLYGKVGRMEQVVGRVRNRDDRETMEEFLGGGDRLIGKLQEILKGCEEPMLLAAHTSKVAGSLGKSSGEEFVNTLWGKERRLKETEKFMQAVRTFNLRFDVNCEALVRNPTR